MIPLKLQIKNFLSYGSQLQEINFQPFNLICLSGKNGHGKSALLDAMTWAIWGQARKVCGTAKPDQGLMRLGQTEMIVIFDFLFNKNKYRIRRDLNFSHGKIHSNLEFAIFENDEKLVTLTDKTIKATQDKVESMIGLNYDSFINSAFLKQGSSNEFSKKSAKERKEILASILGLDKFETLRKKALDKIKNFTFEKDSALKLFDHVQKDLATYDEVNSRLVHCNEKLNQILKSQEKLNQDKAQLDQEKNLLIVSIQEHKLLNAQIERLDNEIQEKLQLLNTFYKQWKELHRKRVNLDINKLKQKKEDLTNDIQNFQKQFEQKLEIKEQTLKIKEQEQIVFKKISHDLNLQINENKIYYEKILNEHANLNEKLSKNEKDLIVQINEINKINAEITKLNKEINVVDEKQLTAEETQFEKRKIFYHKFIAKGNLLNKEIQNLNQKQHFSIDEKNPSCPLCEQNLSASRKKFLKQQLIKKENFLNHQIKRITKVIKTLKDLLLQQNEFIKLQKKSIENNNILKLKIEQLNQIGTSVEKQRNENLILNENILKLSHENLNLIEKQKIKINELETKLNNIQSHDQEYKNLLNLLNDLAIKFDEIKYDQSSHKDAIIQLQIIEKDLSIFANNEQSKNFILDAKNQVSILCKNLKHLNKQINELYQKANQYKDLQKAASELRQKDQDLHASIKQLIEQKELLIQEKGSLENQKFKLEKLSEQHSKHKQLIKQLDESIDEFKIISSALSKDGIQALLIEEAIPEIEYEANDLLSKLTDNQSQIFIESLRDLKKGGTKETLDIKISDASGIRAYEMFSGGEAFRIDFALRISISKLLARRAGTSLQTLIIDEGFGSQDEEGISLIMDCIYKIQEDFSKVIIVSHLPTMKDNFPVHFVVEKLSSGSQVNVIENG